MDIGLMQKHLSDMSILGDPAPLPALVFILLVNLALTLVHSHEEFRGRLWRYFGAIAGFKVPDKFGVVTFSVGLTLLLWAVGIAGITRGVPPFVVVPETCAIAAIGALIGGRTADGIFSHVRLHRAGFRPNPGLKSTPFYFVEALILVVLFFPGLSNYPAWAAGGLAAGVLFFWAVLPSLRVARKVPFWSARREAPWQPWQPRPEWAR